MQPVIAVRDLNKEFKELKAVDQLSFTVFPGEVYGFLGQNGAGKSTTIRMLVTLIAPTSGSIEIFGLDLKRHRKEILTKVGAIIERPDLYKYLTALENLRMFASMSGKRITEKQLMAQLDMVGLADRAQSKVQTYSQGMKQRLGIATALIHDPELVILDEPTNGLDPQGIADIRNLILHLSREMHKTVLVSSHLLSEMELVADSMIIIDKGKKLVEGKVKELFDPAETMVLLKTTNDVLYRKRIQQSSLGKSLQHDPETMTFKINHADIPAAIRQLVEMDVPVISFTPQHSLESYFLSLTSGKQHVEPFKN